MSKTKKAVILLSGGLDSTTVMAMAREMGFERYALSFDYGQRHALELDAARRAVADFGARDHLVLRVDLDKIGGSALTGPMAVPKGAAPDGEPEAIPVTYVPARNTVFLSLALAWAETLGAFDIFIGVNAIDYSGYPDCRPEYIEAFERMANLATKACVEGRGRVRIQTPLIQMTKAQIVQKGLALGVDFSKTHSCYDPSPEGLACGECDSCVLRKQGFEKAGLIDPALLR
jgi:7-cyano-7-deazaguanine synthase